MADPQAQIRTKLTSLVRDGANLKFALMAKVRPDAAEEALSKFTASTSKTRGAKRDAATKKSPEANEQNQAAAQVAVTELERSLSDFPAAYQRWYSEALRVVEQLLPERYEEFRQLYRVDKAPKELTVSTYTLSDYVLGITVTSFGQDKFNVHESGIH